MEGPARRQCRCYKGVPQRRQSNVAVSGAGLWPGCRSSCRSACAAESRCRSAATFWRARRCVAVSNDIPISIAMTIRPSTPQTATVMITNTTPVSARPQHQQGRAGALFWCPMVRLEADARPPHRQSNGLPSSRCSCSFAGSSSDEWTLFVGARADPSRHHHSGRAEWIRDSPAVGRRSSFRRTPVAESVGSISKSSG